MRSRSTNYNISYEIHADALKVLDEMVEIDKNNTNPKDLLGIKKPSLSLVPPCAIIEIAEAMKDGAKKYGAYNWRKKKVRMTVYLDALLRHTLALIDGDDKTRDSGVSNLAAIGANISILIDAKETGNLIDDRPTKGKAGDLIERLSK